MNPNNLKAGRELDAMVAEKVLGHHKLNWIGEMPADAYAPYSTDIAAAWLVVEKMRELGFKKRELWSEYHGIWLAEFDRYQPGNSEMEPSEAPTAPLAICLAALKAVGHEVP